MLASLLSPTIVALVPPALPLLHSTAATRPAVRMMAEEKNSYAGPDPEDACYLFEAEGVCVLRLACGTCFVQQLISILYVRRRRLKYVCTSEPGELAFMMGVEEKDLVEGVKPDDLDLIECAEEWSHVGTPQWTCTAKVPSGEAWVGANKKK